MDRELQTEFKIVYKKYIRRVYNRRYRTKKLLKNRVMIKQLFNETIFY